MKVTRTQRAIPMSIVAISASIFGLLAEAGNSDHVRLKQATLNSRFDAHDVVERAYQAEQSAAYADVSILYLNVEAHTFTDREAARHDDSWQSHPIVDDYHFFWDFENHQFRAFQFRTNHGGLTETSETLFRDETVYSILPASGTYRQRTMRLNSVHGYTGHGFHAWLDIVSPFTPHMWKQMPFGISYIGSTTVDGQTVDMIEAPWPGSPRRPRYYIGRDSGRILMGTSYFPDPLDGDISTLIRFDGRKEINGLPVPETLPVSFADGWNEVRTIRDIRSLKDLPEDFFALDEGLRPAPDPWQVVDVTTHVKEVRDPGIAGVNVHYVVLEDFVVVIDTPPSGPASRHLINLIAEETEKPIRYLVLTHGHELNIGGVREFVAHGATVITSSSAETLVRRFVDAPGSRFGGSFSRDPISDPEIVLVAPGRTHTLGSSEQSLVIRNIGDLPHAEAVLVAQLEDDDLVVTGDVYTRETPNSTTSNAFFEWARTSDLGNPTIAGSRHEPASLEALIQKAEQDESAVHGIKRRIERALTPNS